MANTELWTNNAVTTLAGNGGAITAGALSLNVASSVLFPAPAAGQQFRVLIDGEIIIVTAVASLAWTVTRGADGTTAASHSDGATVYGILTAAQLGLLLQSSGSIVNQILAGIGVNVSPAGGTGNVTVNAHPGIYGDGSDGAATCDGSLAVAGMSRASLVYTLTRDVYFTNLTINNTVTVKTNGFRIFCTGTLTNNGTITNDGAAGGSSAGGAGGPLIGGSTTNVGANGGAINTVGPASAGQIGLGGQGGAGGTGTGPAGGAGGAITNSLGAVHDVDTALSLVVFGAGTIAIAGGGSGGGGGGGAPTISTGDGGGGGGGTILIAALLIAGTGAIHARGGAGGVSGGNQGGGGGGGGGAIYIVSHSISGGAITGQTIDCAGGTVSGSHPGSAGANGTATLVAN